MPALQFEFPMDIRKELMTNDELIDGIAKAIVDCYKNSVASIYNKDWKDIQLRLDDIKKELSEHTEPKHHISKSEEMITQMMNEFSTIESQQKNKKI